jgi:hypothetical protein
MKITDITLAHLPSKKSVPIVDRGREIDDPLMGRPKNHTEALELADVFVQMPRFISQLLLHFYDLLIVHLEPGLALVTPEHPAQMRAAIGKLAMRQRNVCHNQSKQWQHRSSLFMRKVKCGGHDPKPF